MFRFFLGFLIALSLISTSCAQHTQETTTPKNIILFIGDGMGYNHVDATSIFFFGETGQLIFEGKDWIRVAQATYPAIISTEPDTVFSTGYNTRLAWNDSEYLRKDYTDSGSAGTALSTGFKTYRSSIGLGPKGDTLEHLTQRAKMLGKAAGVITSVQLSHATPAAFTAHNNNRRNYSEIARQMILERKLDVLMGCGHPDYNNDGKPSENDHKYVGGQELWKQLISNDPKTSFNLEGREYILPDVSGNGLPDAWTLITDSVDFAHLAQGEDLPSRVLGIPKVHSTLQQSRSGNEVQMPFDQPRTSQLPTLEQMTLASINVLNQNPNGFFLMVEGGAIDWAGHDNHSGRLIEEMADFVNSVSAAVEWVEKHSSWDETLIIVTSDHETGMLWGPQTGKSSLTPIKSYGKGVLPGMEWHYTDHTNTLVPLYARGVGSDMFKFFADELDAVKGPFIQNTEVAKTVFLLWGK